jgi:hypothetical protein
VLLGAAAGGAGGVELLGFFEAVALGVDVDDLGAVDEAVDERDDAGGVREDLAPFGEGLVGAEQNGLLRVVAAGDDLEEKVGVAAVVGEVADLVDAEQVGHGVAMEASGERDGGLLRGEIGEHVAGGGEADGVAADDSLMGDVFEDHGFADAVGTDEDSVVAGLDEAEGEELVDGFAIDLLGPSPVEVGHRLEGGDAGIAETAFQAALLALALLDGEHLRQPGFVGDFVITNAQSGR